MNTKPPIEFNAGAVDKALWKIWRALCWGVKIVFGIILLKIVINILCFAAFWIYNDIDSFRKYEIRAKKDRMHYQERDIISIEDIGDGYVKITKTWSHR